MCVEEQDASCVRFKQATSPTQQHPAWLGLHCIWEDRRSLSSLEFHYYSVASDATYYYYLWPFLIPTIYSLVWTCIRKCSLLLRVARLKLRNSRCTAACPFYVSKLDNLCLPLFVFLYHPGDTDDSRTGIIVTSSTWCLVPKF